MLYAIYCMNKKKLTEINGGFGRLARFAQVLSEASLFVRYKWGRWLYVRSGDMERGLGKRIEL